MDTHMDTPIPPPPLTGVPSWISGAQPTRRHASVTRQHASHVTSPRSAGVTPGALPAAATKPIR